MIKSIERILAEGEKSGFSTVEVFGEKVVKEEYECLKGDGNDENDSVRFHSVSSHRVTARAFWDVGDPVGFCLSKPGGKEITRAFSSIYSADMPAQKKNYAPLLPTAIDRVKVRIYDDSIDSIDARAFDELIAQIDEILISSPFKGLALSKIYLSKALKKNYIANSRGLDTKYIKSNFNLRLGFRMGGHQIEISENRVFFRQFGPFKLVSRAYNLLNSLTDSKIDTGQQNLFLILAPEAAAFILREFSEFFKISADNKKLRDIPYPSILNIVDDPLMDDKSGSVPFDDEGVQMGKKFLIKKGAFSGLISDTRSAFHRGVRSSGNGFRSEKSMFPAVRFSNLYIKPTVLSLKNLMDDAENGILVSLLKLKYVDREGYIFSAYGYRFSRDELLEPVHFYFRAGFISYFLNIRKISKEIKFFHSAFNTGAPYILVEAKRKQDLFEI
ncbi:MAG: hypothetical protein GY757_57100 [bacterium]|nr:hypothetical protein [bacterium]